MVTVKPLWERDVHDGHPLHFLTFSISNPKNKSSICKTAQKEAARLCAVMNDSGKASGESSPADDAALPTTIYAAGILRASPRCEPDSLGSQYTPKSRTMRLIRHRLALLGYRNGAVEARQPRRHD